MFFIGTPFKDLTYQPQPCVLELCTAFYDAFVMTILLWILFLRIYSCRDLRTFRVRPCDLLFMQKASPVFCL